jgi:hypothetical protein
MKPIKMYQKIKKEKKEYLLKRKIGISETDQ